MSYLVLARKYRPQTFGDLTGQETTTKILKSAILKNRVGSAYLFSGTRGTGKTTTARIFAKTLNCHKAKERPLEEPCNECPSCLEIMKGSSLDVLEIDAASHTQVDNIRDVVINTVNFASVRDLYKIFIIDEVHMLSNHSFNALLKTIEEPPARVVFILCTTEFHKIPSTISSRCQRFRYLPLTPKEVAQNLTKVARDEKIEIDEAALALIAKAAAGSMRDGLSLLDQVISHCLGEQVAQKEDAAKKIGLNDVEETLGVVREELLVQFLEQVAAKNAKGVLDSIGQVLNDGYDLSYFLREVRESFRQMLIEKCGYKDEDPTFRVRAALPTDRFTLHQILRAAQLLTKCSSEMRWNDLPRTVFECTAVWLCEESVGIDEIMKKLEGSGGDVKAESHPSAASVVEPYRTSKPASSSFSPAPQPQTQTFTKPTEFKSPNSSPSFQAQSAAAVIEALPAQEEPAENIVPVGTLVPDNSKLWLKVLEEVMQFKPSFSRALETASLHIGADRVELGFSKPLWLEGARKNQKFLEDTFYKYSGKRYAITIKLAEANSAVASAAPKALTQDDVFAPMAGVEEVSLAEIAAEEESGGAAAGDESMSSAPSVTSVAFSAVAEEYDPHDAERADQIADEGLQSFVKAFPGKLTRVQ